MASSLFQDNFLRLVERAAILGVRRFSFFSNKTLENVVIGLKHIVNFCKKETASYLSTFRA